MKRAILIVFTFIFGIVQLFADQSLSNSEKLKRVGKELYILKDSETYRVDSKSVIVKPKLNRKSSSIIIYNAPNILGYYCITVPNNIPVEEYVKQLRSSELFEEVDFNAYGEFFMIPNDTEINEQWYLERINAFDAWNITTGDPSVKIAVLDTGIKCSHYDIGTGSDGYSNVNNSMGYNATTFTNEHGTAVASIIGAKTNNMQGIAGIAGGNHCQGATIIPYYITETPTSFIVGTAIKDAVDQGVNVIQMSLGTDSTSFMKSVLDYAYNHNVTVICASGNGGVPSVRFPARYSSVIAVGATTSTDQRWIYSCYGANLDLVAPGDSIYHATFDDFISNSGTSLAAPQVSAVAALMLSVNPNLTPDEIRTILHITAYKIPLYSFDFNSYGWCEWVGYGLLDAYAAVDMAQYYISGNDTLCLSDVYQAMALPTGATVTWTLSGSNASKFNLVQDSPSTNKCTITKKANSVFSYQSFTLTLTANIYQGGTLIKTKAKTLTCNNGFTCTYWQDAHEYYGVNYPAITQTQMTSATNYVYPGGIVFLQSEFFRGKVINTSGIFDNFQHVGQNIVKLSLPPYSSSPAYINVEADGCDEALQLTFYPMSYYSMGSYSATLSVVSEQEYRISLVRNEEVSAEDTVDATRTIAENSEADGKVSWTVEAVNALTGRKVLSIEPEGTDYVLSTVGWESGLYILRVIVGGEVVATQKIYVR